VISVLIAVVISACSEPKWPEGHGPKDIHDLAVGMIYIIENKRKTHLLMGCEAATDWAVEECKPGK
jgi:hypothetical protein